MFSHIMIGTNDIEESRVFYDKLFEVLGAKPGNCLLYTSPSPRDVEESRMPSSA